MVVRELTRLRAALPVDSAGITIVPGDIVTCGEERDKVIAVRVGRPQHGGLELEETDLVRAKHWTVDSTRAAAEAARGKALP